MDDNEEKLAQDAQGQTVSEEPQASVAAEPTAIAAKPEQNLVDFEHLQKYNNRLKATIPYFLISGDDPADTGAEGTEYSLETADLYPTAPAPKEGSVVLFTTTAASYIGQVTVAQGTTVTVTVRKKLLG